MQMKPMAWGLSVLLAAFCLLQISRAEAAACSCTCIISSSTMPFGAYVPTSSSATDISGSVGVQCTTLTSQQRAYAIQIQSGNNYAGGTRRLSNGVIIGGASYLEYNFFTDSGRGIVWGDGSFGTAPSDSYTANGTVTKNYPVYGRIRAQQPVPPGSYSDNVMVTIAF
jgi:spore coat protein U-like protein